MRALAETLKIPPPLASETKLRRQSPPPNSKGQEHFEFLFFLPKYHFPPHQSVYQHQIHKKIVLGGQGLPLGSHSHYKNEFSNRPSIENNPHELCEITLTNYVFACLCINDTNCMSSSLMRNY